MHGKRAARKQEEQARPRPCRGAVGPPRRPDPLVGLLTCGLASNPSLAPRRAGSDHHPGFHLAVKRLTCLHSLEVRELVSAEGQRNPRCLQCPTGHGRASPQAHSRAYAPSHERRCHVAAAAMTATCKQRVLARGDASAACAGLPALAPSPSASLPPRLPSCLQHHFQPRGAAVPGGVCFQGGKEQRTDSHRRARHRLRMLCHTGRTRQRWLARSSHAGAMRQGKTGLLLGARSSLLI